MLNTPFRSIETSNMDANQLAQAMGGGAGAGGKKADPLAGDQKNNMPSQILDQQARARLNTIGAADPKKLQEIEALLMRMAQQGQITRKMDEAGLKNVLDQISAQSQNEIKVTYNRRKVFDSDEDDDGDY